MKLEVEKQKILIPQSKLSNFIDFPQESLQQWSLQQLHQIPKSNFGFQSPKLQNRIPQLGFPQLKTLNL